MTPNQVLQEFESVLTHLQHDIFEQEQSFERLKRIHRLRIVL